MTALPLSALELERSRTEQSLRFQQQNADRIGRELEGLRTQLQQLLESAENDRREIREKTEKIQSLTQEAADSDLVKVEEEEELQALRQENEELLKQQDDASRDRESTAEVIAGLDKEVFRLTSRRERLEESIEQKASYMWEEYEITIADAAAQRDETLTDLAAMKKEIADLRGQIKALGHVNVGAIDEYKELMVRYTFRSKGRSTI